MSDVKAHDASPFGDAPPIGPVEGDSPTVDVSQAAMSRLRTPFNANESPNNPTPPTPQSHDH